MNRCLLCKGEFDEEELKCKQCSCSLHFSCALGTEINNKKQQIHLRNGNYKCPVCVVARDNELVLKTVSTNQHHILTTKKDFTSDFTLPESFTALANAPSSLSEEVEGSDSQVHDESRPLNESIIQNSHA